MGYDLYMVDTIRGEHEALAEIDPLWDAAVAARNALPKEARGSFQKDVDGDTAGWDQPFANATAEYAAAQREVMRISDLRDSLNRSYFRLNIWGMARYRDVMELVGMGHWSDQPEWPEQADFQITNEQSWALGRDDEVEDEDAWNAMDENTRDRVLKFRHAQNDVLSAHPGETPGIPLWKFGSNDGWHVTPVECSSALQILGEWLIEGYIGPDSIDGDPWTWQDALDSYRKADEGERKIIIANAAARHQMEPVLVGHPPFSADEEDDRQSQLDVLSEDYWLQWLQYLTDGVHAGGFRVH